MNKKLLSIAALCTLISFTECTKTSSTYGSTTEGNWIKKAALSGPVRAQAVSFVIGDTAYVGTGYAILSGANQSLSDFWKYDPNTNTWLPIASIPVARYYAVGFSIGSNGYVGTGIDNPTTQNNLKDFYAYNPSTNTWTKKADFTGTERNRAVGFGLNGKGYIGTGYDKYVGVLADFYAYDPTTDTWSDAPYLPGSKRYGASTFIYNNKAYVVCGYGGSGLVYDIYSFDGTAWSTSGALRNISSTSTESYDDDYTDIARFNAVAFVIGDYAYLATGTTTGSSGVTTTWAYDIQNDQWGRRSPYQRTARWGAVGFTVAGKAFVGTGQSGTAQTSFYDNFSQFDPSVDLDENADKD